MEIHSYQGSLDPLWNSTAMVGASEKPFSVALPVVSSCDIKSVFYELCYTSMAAKRHRGAASRSHGGRGQLWKFIATKPP
jgi:hypothetical protein